MLLNNGGVSCPLRQTPIHPHAPELRIRRLTRLAWAQSVRIIVTA